MQITQNYCGLHNAIMQQQQQQLNAAYCTCNSQLLRLPHQIRDRQIERGMDRERQGVGTAGQTVGQSIVYYFKLAAQKVISDHCKLCHTAKMSPTRRSRTIRDQQQKKNDWQRDEEEGSKRSR